MKEREKRRDWSAGRCEGVGRGRDGEGRRDPLSLNPKVSQSLTDLGGFLNHSISWPSFASFLPPSLYFYHAFLFFLLSSSLLTLFLIVK